jgi:hypothetical protein
MFGHRTFFEDQYVRHLAPVLFVNAEVNERVNGFDGINDFVNDAVKGSVPL